MTPKSESTSLDQWLEAELLGQLAYPGTFTVDALGADRHGFSQLDSTDVPLLVLAGAVEANSRYFRVHGGRDVVLSWEGSLGPSGLLAYSLLENFQVDISVESERLVLPPLFWDLLTPLRRRWHNAPLQRIWGNKELQSGTPRNTMSVSPSRESRLVLVDRGIDFELPTAFPGLEVTAWVGPLPGAPWPTQLAWSPALRTALRGIDAALECVLN